MIRQEFWNLNLAKLGAINGFVFGSLIQTVFVLSRLCFEIYYFINDVIRNWNKIFGTGYVPESNLNGGEIVRNDFPLLSLPIATLLIVALVCFFVQRLFAPRIKSTILLWQVVGLFSGAFCYFYQVAYMILQRFKQDCLEPFSSSVSQCRQFQIFDYSQLNWSILAGLLFFIGVSLSFNLLFASALRHLKPSMP